MDENEQMKDLENKYVFWDIDGTLAPYRFNKNPRNGERYLCREEKLSYQERKL